MPTSGRMTTDVAKRQYGTGCLYRRGRVWWIKYFAGQRPVHESAGTSDRKAAEAILKKRLAVAELDQLPDPAAQKLTVKDILGGLRSDYDLRGRKSLPQLDSRIRLHLEPLLGSMQAVGFGNRQVEAYVRKRRSDGAADAAINRELEHVRAAFRLAVDGDRIPKAPKIRLLQEDNVRTGFLEHPQFVAVRQALPAYLIPLFVVAYHVGCRLGELLQLRWEQVDFPASQVWLESRQTKAKTARVLPVYGEMRDVLLEAFRERNESFPDCPLVFHHYGNPIVDFRKAWRTACRLAEVEWLRFHDLRRSAVRNMDRAGIPRSTIRRIIGHETDAMFERYRIVDQRDIQEAGVKAGKYLDEQQQSTVPGGRGVIN